MKRSDVDEFEKLVGQLESLYDEVSVLSKKRPTDALNLFKLKFVNDLLLRANQVLGSGYRPFENFTEFDADDVPQNSDVVFMLSQYLQCLEKLRADNVQWDVDGWYWVVGADPGEKGEEHGKARIPTVRPKKLRE